MPVAAAPGSRRGAARLGGRSDGGDDRRSSGRSRRAGRRASRPRRSLGLRLVLWGIAAVVAYVVLTAAQVVWAAGQDSGARADAVVVLGAAQYDGEPSGALRGRLDHAAELYRARRAPRIVVTGGNQPGDRTTEGMTGFVYLRNVGVPEEALLVENGSTNTWEQLSATKLILDERGLRRVLLVSDPYHNLRLLGIAGQVGLDAEVSATDTPVHAGDVLRETAAVSVGRVLGYRRLATIA